MCYMYMYGSTGPYMYRYSVHRTIPVAGAARPPFVVEIPKSDKIHCLGALLRQAPYRYTPYNPPTPPPHHHIHTYIYLDR